MSAWSLWPQLEAPMRSTPSGPAVEMVQRPGYLGSAPPLDAIFDITTLELG